MEKPSVNNARELTWAMRTHLRRYWWVPKIGRDPMHIDCPQGTGDAMVRRGWATRHKVGTKVEFRLTPAGLSIARIVREQNA